jgi:hypothetical protein
MTYDYFEGGLPQDWNALQPVWFDADQCGTSEYVLCTIQTSQILTQSRVKPIKQNGTFTVTGNTPWKPNFSGTVAGLGGHLHDVRTLQYHFPSLFQLTKSQGGVSINLKVNNALLCSSRASYATSPEYIFAKPKMPMPGGEVIATNHISKMSTCYYDEVAAVGRVLDPSQTWVIDGVYDYDKYQGNLDSEGEQSDLMAIAIMYVSVAREGVKAPKKAEGLSY